MLNEKPTTVDQYISLFPEETQKKLQLVRTTIKSLAPEAEETIGYGIPTYKLNGNLVHFAAYKNHIGFYPGAKGVAIYADDLVGYKQAKGSIQFPLNKPMPIDIITKITLFRVQENLRKNK